MLYDNTDDYTQDSVAPVTNHRGDKTDAKSRIHPPYSLFPDLVNCTGKAPDSAPPWDEQRTDAEPNPQSTCNPSAGQTINPDPPTINTSLIFHDDDSAVSLSFQPNDTAQNTLNAQPDGMTARSVAGIENSVARRLLDHKYWRVPKAEFRAKTLDGVREKILTHNFKKGPNDPSLALLYHPSICNISSDVLEREPETTSAQQSSCQSNAV
jgi:hypothetical protein